MKNSTLKENKTIGYTTGVFDLFHIGHLNILIKSKQFCDHLIVGVTTDELCEKIKNKKPVIPFEERIQIIKSIKYVDEVVAQDKIDEIGDYHKLKFNYIIKGSDWEGTDKWNKLEKEFLQLGVKVKYLQYTQNTSSTLIRQLLQSTLLK